MRWFGSRVLAADRHGRRYPNPHAYHTHHTPGGVTNPVRIFLYGPHRAPARNPAHDYAPHSCALLSSTLSMCPSGAADTGRSRSLAPLRRLRSSGLTCVGRIASAWCCVPIMISALTSNNRRTLISRHTACTCTRNGGERGVPFQPTNGQPPEGMHLLLAAGTGHTAILEWSSSRRPHA